MVKLEELAYRISTDPDLRAALQVAPQQALARAGFNLTPAELQTLSTLCRTLVLSSYKLDLLLRTVQYPTNWGGAAEPIVAE